MVESIVVRLLECLRDGDKASVCGLECSDVGLMNQGLLDAGVTLIDTAEVYGFGKSEEFLGEFMQDSDVSPVISTKFAPLPWRQSADSVPMALEQSLRRLKVDKVGHYMIHWWVYQS